MHVARLGLLGLASLVLVACGDDAAGPAEPDVQPQTSVRGGLDRVTFYYHCAGPADAQCNVDADLAPLREESPLPAIAKGARFKIGASSTSYPVLRPAAISDTFFTTEGDNVFVAERAGAAALVAQQDDGTPIDFANLTVVRPSQFKILQATPQGDFRGANLDIGGGSISGSASVKYTFKFRAVALDDEGNILAGALPCEWRSSRPDVVRLTSDPASNVAVLESVAAGTSEVTVTLGEFTGVIRLEVGQ